MKRDSIRRVAVDAIRDTSGGGSSSWRMRSCPRGATRSFHPTRNNGGVLS
jgi:hypothetical protein